LSASLACADADCRELLVGLHDISPSGSPVAASRIWSEHVQKELRNQVVRPASEFSPNPARTTLLPDKPNDRSRELALRQDEEAERVREQKMATLKVEDPQAHAQVMSRLEHASRLPRERNAYPATSNQEIGWDVQQSQQHMADHIAHSHPHKDADVTAYAGQ
jgi:hypothetical protein